MAAVCERTRGRATGSIPQGIPQDSPLGVAEPAPWAVHLPGFDGPLDLLLHLIERNQLEITTISLVAVTDQFVAYLRTVG